MASSPEARPAGVADAPPTEDHTETSRITVEEPSAAQVSESRPQAKEPESEPPKTSESSDDAEAEDRRTDTDKAVEEPSIPTDDGGAAATVYATFPPPLPDEPLPDEKDENDDGWDPMWSDEHQAWYFVNRFTQQTQWENPRVPDAEAGAGAGVGGYNPAIHGDYDPNAWYAKGGSAAAGADAIGDDNIIDSDAIAAAAAAAAAVIQGDSLDPGSSGRYSHDAKVGRQLNGFFDEATAGGAHDGRSLKAERSGIKPSKSELKAFKEKRRARKEEKRRAWLRD